MFEAKCKICKETIIENFFYRDENTFKAVGICCYDDYKDKKSLFEVRR